ncbi:hypothetical protein MNAN1_000173 [Malassezia nana]|uniref:Trafficking protein particle complex subunit 10 n=1 Tax=Malassezia nana TaxID=180528 RepID=A0AAF0J0W2_9BASI|nr:hypothetical protein MNAN1_000173 [Malassezia nana]
MATPATAADGPEPLVPITYATHSSSTAIAQTAHAVRFLREHLPLRNLLWRPSRAIQCLHLKSPADTTGTPIRTLQDIPVHLVPLATHDASDRRIPLLYRLPPVHLFFVACDDSDVYRAQVRNEIRNWMAALHHHMPPDYEGLRATVDGGRDVPAHLTPEYLIVLLPSGTSQAGSALNTNTGKMGRFYPINKGTVYEKLRADFNTSTTEHVLALPRVPASADDNDPAIWIELLARMKESTLASITRLVELQDRLAVSYDTISSTPTWSLCTSILRREHLVQTLEALGLVQESLTLYEQITAQLADPRTPGTTRLAPGGTDTGDDSLLLLGPLRKPYVAQLEKETISLFDLHSYLYARTSMLLGALGQVVPVMERTPAFIDTITQLLRPHTHTLARGFLETWSFSTALDAVEQCQAWLVEAQGEREDDTTMRACHAAKAALLELAVRQLVRIGVQIAHLPAEPPFAFYSPVPSDACEPGARLTRKEIVEAMAHRDVYDSQCRHLLQRTKTAAQLSGQVYRILRAQFLLASLERVRGAFSTALALYTELAQHPALPHTLALYAPVHAQRLHCLAALPASNDTTEAVMDALHCVCQLRHRPSCAADLDEMALLSSLRGTPDAAPATMVGYNGCAFRMAHTRIERHGDTVSMTVPIVSFLPAPLDVDAVHVWVMNYRQDQLQCTSAPVTLQPGANEVVLTCATPLHGYFHVQATQLALPHVRLESVVQSSASLSSLADAQQLEYTRPRLCLPADATAVRVRLSVPRDVRLDERRMVRLHLDSGAQALRVAHLTLTTMDDTRLAPVSEWRVVPGTQSAPPSSSDAAAEALSISAMPPDASWAWDIPITHMARDAPLELAVTLRYHGPDDEAPLRVWHRVLRVSLALPFHIHIQDFFRMDTLLSKLAFEALSAEPVRLCAPTVRAAPDSPIDVAVPAGGTPLWLVPHKTSTFLVQFTRRPNETRRTNPPFELSVSYRTAHDEWCGRVLAALAHVLAMSDALDWAQGDGLLLQDVLCEAGPSYEDAAWHRVLQRWCWDPKSARARTVLALVRRVYTSLATEAPDATAAPPDATAKVPSARAAWEASRTHLEWRTLRLPVDVPMVDIVNAVAWEAPPAPPLVLGEAREVRIHVTMSFGWAAHDEERSAVHVQYQVLAEHDTWVVQGAKKGTWILDTTQGPCERTIHATLRPVRTGFLLFPRVRIAPVAPTSRPIRCETYVTQTSPGLHVVPPHGPETYWVETRAPEWVEGAAADGP